MSRAALWGGVCLTVWAAVITMPAACGQQKPSVMVRHRTRLILKDHSYQLVVSYRIQGDRVLYVSAERGQTAEEEIPAALVDFEATHRWEKEHAGDNSDDTAQVSGRAPAIDPDLLKEEEKRRALTPEVAPDLLLPEQDSVVALDNFKGTPELVPLAQATDDLNPITAHSVQRLAINPMASAHAITRLRGEQADVQLHVSQPVLYVRMADAEEVSTGAAPLIVDTHGASSAQVNRSEEDPAESRYAIVRMEVRQGERVVTSFDPGTLSVGRPAEAAAETVTEVLPGGHWMKVIPKKPLDPGEYALMEVISQREINLSVWGFGIRPSAPESLDALRPVPKRPLTLERRDPE